MQTKDAFVNDDDLNREEVMEAAVDKRKFLIKRILKKSMNYFNILPKLLRELESIYKASLLQIKQLNNDLVHKKVI